MARPCADFVDQSAVRPGAYAGLIAALRLSFPADSCFLSHACACAQPDNDSCVPGMAGKRTTGNEENMEHFTYGWPMVTALMAAAGSRLQAWRYVPHC
jgi:hypothetical protein